MIHFLFKSPLPFHAHLRNLISGVLYLKSFSALSQSPKKRTVDYLVNNLGFSQDSALAVAKHIHLKGTTKPDSVLALFKTYGFTTTHITTIFSRSPALLLSDADYILKPKLEFFAQHGISGQALIAVITADPSILRRSLNKLVPSIEMLESFFGSTKEIISLFSVKRGTWVVHKFSESMAPNIETLRAHGVPDSNIAKMILLRPKTLSRDVHEFTEIVKEVKQLGSDPSSLMFIHALCSLSGMKKDKWASKVQVFESCGWSEEQVRSLFVKQPKCMNSSEEQIKRALCFFMTELEWTADDIAKYPIVLNLSFEKRVVPRSSILKDLLSKGLIKKVSVGKAFLLREDKFLLKFVTAYLEREPHLFEMYQKKMAIS